MGIPPIQSRKVDAERLPLEELASNTAVPEADKIKEASKQFEALLLRQILQETQQPVFASSLVGNTAIDGIYRDLMVEQLANSISESGSFGLAQSLSHELQRQSKPPEPSAKHLPNSPFAHTPRPQP